MDASILQPGLQVQFLHSDLIGQDLELYIKLPWRYEQSDVTYPVLYTLDANGSFPLYSTMSSFYETPGANTDEIVIVGVGYKLDADRMRGFGQWVAWRTRDYTPVRRPQLEQQWRERLCALVPGQDWDVQSGCAPLFLRSLAQEIIPFIQANYRVSQTDRGLAGYSYGGLFALYALFHAPELFARYFAGSPSMWDTLFEYEEQYARADAELRGKVFITAGGLETDRLERIRRFMNCIESRGYPGLQLRMHVFEGEGHTAAYAGAVSRALCMLYNEDWLKS